MNLENYKIGFIGFGHMAQILFQRLVSSDLIRESQVFFAEKDEVKTKKIIEKFDIEPISLSKINQTCRLILICVTPQNIQEVLNEIKVNSNKQNLYISILAGTKIERLQKELGPENMIMKALPNVASSIGEGIIPLCFNSSCSVDMKTIGMLLFTSLGMVVEISEKLMDIVCGICGCLPAFVLKMVDEIAKMGMQEGLTYEMSLKLTAQAFAGSAKLIQKEKNIDQLIKTATSPNGATEAGLEVLKTLGVLSGLKESVKASINRSSELSNI